MKKMICFLLVTVLLISSFPIVAYASDEFQTWEELISYYKNKEGFRVYQTYDYHGDYSDSGYSFTVLEGIIDGVKYSVACKPWTGEDRWTDSHELSKVDSLAYVEGYYGTDSQITIPAKFLNHFDISWNPCSIVGLGFNTNSKQLESIDVSSDNKYLSSENGVLFNKDKTMLLKYPAGKKEESYNVPQGVTSLGAGAFSNSTYLKHLTLPENFQEIKAFAFADCSSIETIYSDGVTSIGSNAFDNCFDLMSIEFNGNLESLGVNDTSILVDHSYMFWNCKKLESVIIPHGTADIPSYFLNSSSVKYVELPNNCQEIGAGAFNGCSKLVDITIPVSVRRIGSFAFSGCTSLKSIIIPESVTKIEEFTFSGCTNLENVSLSSKTTFIGSSAFGNCSLLQSIVLPDTVAEIGNSAFSDCNLQAIKLPLYLDEVSIHAFSSNRTKQLNLNNGLTKIEMEAFRCGEFEKVSIPDTVQSIGDRAFSSCRYLAELTLSRSLKEIGESAFSYCNLKEIIIPDNVETIGDYAFAGNAIKSFTIGKSVSSLGIDFINNVNSLENVYVNDDNEYYFDISGILFDKATNEIIIYPTSSTAEVVTIPKGTTTLPDIHSNNLKVLNIPTTVTSIGKISNSVNLESINVAEGNPVYYSIDGILFSKATNEMLIYPKGNTTQTLTIPEGVEKLCGIDSTELKTLNLSSTVIDFGDLNCDNLETINVNQNSNTYCSVDGVLYNKSLTEMLYYPWGNAMTDYHIPDTVVTLRGELGGTWYSGNNRFGHGTKYLKNIYVPKSVTDFGRYPFTLCGDCIENIIVDKSNPVYHSENGIMYKGSSVAAYPQNNKTKDFHIPEGTNGVAGTSYLNGCRYVENVYMPASLTKFNFGLFEFCDSLKNIYVDENNPDFCDIDGILYNKQKTRLVCYPRGKENDVVVLPDGTEELEYCSFYKCNQITGLVIPQSMKNLNGYAFIQCENLREFTFNKDIQSISGIGYVLGGGPGAGGWKIGDIENVTIRGYSGTVAESYARDNGFTFISLGKVDRLLGDTDADDSVTVVDATVIQRHLAEIPTAVYIEAAADADQDGQVTILDATAIQRWLAELPVYEGIGKIFV